MNAKTLLLMLAGVALRELAGADTLLPHVPLILWSKHSTFEGIESYSGVTVDAATVASTLQDALSTSQSTATTPVELLAVFLPTTLQTEDVAKMTAADATQSFVQRAVQDAATSAVLPHTTRSTSLVAALTANAVAFTDVAIEQLETFLSTREGQMLVANDKTDLLIVRIPTDQHSLPAIDALIHAASEVLTSATKESVAFALTGDTAVPLHVRPTPQQRRRLAANTSTTSTTAALACETGLILGTAGGKAFCFSHYVHMTPDVLTGLLFGFFFVFLAYVGISALNAIQTPTRYPLHGPPRGKEF